MTTAASAGRSLPREGLRHGQMSSRPIRRLRGILAPIVTDFAFRDLAPHTLAEGDHGDGEAAVEVLAHRGAFPAPGTVIRDLQHPMTGEHLLSVYEGVDGLQWRVDGLGTFWVDASGWRIRYALEEGASLADAESLLLGPVLGVAAQQRGETLLHASSVVVDGGAIAFSASHGMGKSTLAASFIRDGLPLASDDILPVEWSQQGRPLAHPYFPRTKLRDDSLRTLRGDDAPAGEPAVSWFDKQRYRVGEGWGTLAERPVPLRVLYFLRPSADPEQAIELTRLEGLEAAVLVQTAIYSPQTLRGRRAAQALDIGVRLAASVPVVIVTYHRDYRVLPALRARLLEHARSLAS